MGTPHDDPSVSRRVRSYRQRMRARGMRPIQMWVADVRAPGFAAEAHRQAVAIAASDQAADDQAFIDAISLDQT
ncbi:MAG: antitoxin MazE family protein [Actinobacteria bacterium]|nr:antitoxin MazE family protein [Actinomycetota bacterium]MBU1492661.1 antitoxin MazE family protein [Actinomycetota bacterium]MBU1866020.1 antitoxin MazE family protein [Actinomycetota bacterium]